MTDVGLLQLDPYQRVININWAPPQDFLLGGVDHSSGSILPGSSGPALLVGSKDGKDFFSYNTSGLDAGIASLTYGGGFWFAVTYSGKVFRSKEKQTEPGEEATHNFDKWTQIHTMPVLPSVGTTLFVRRRHYIAYGKAADTDENEYDPTLMVVAADPSFVFVGDTSTPAPTNNYIAISTNATSTDPDQKPTFTLTSFTNARYVLTSCRFLKDDKGGAFYVTETPTAFNFDVHSVAKLPTRYWRSPDGGAWAKKEALSKSFENLNYFGEATPWFNSTLSGVALSDESTIVAVGTVPSERPAGELHEYFMGLAFHPGATVTSTERIGQLAFFDDLNFNPTIASDIDSGNEEIKTLGTTANLFEPEATENIVGVSTPDGAFANLTSQLGGTNENDAFFGAINYSKTAKCWVSTGHHVDVTNRSEYKVFTSKTGTSWSSVIAGKGELNCVALGKIPTPPAEET